MSEPFFGEIRLFPYTFAPVGWSFCMGQTLLINSNPALYSILGWTFGGDQRTYFCLPNLASVAIVGAGQAPGQQNYKFGTATGVNSVTLQPSQSPIHKHTLNALVSATPSDSTCTNVPSGTANLTRTGIKGTPTPITKLYQTTATDGVILSPYTLSPTATTITQPHDNHQPYMVMHYCIAVDGLYPTRP